jgi:hypothetical protein
MGNRMIVGPTTTNTQMCVCVIAGQEEEEEEEEEEEKMMIVTWLACGGALNTYSHSLSYLSFNKIICK